MRPVRIIPWSRDFIAALAEDLTARAGADGLPGLRVVFPHSRPARHLRAALAAHPDFPRPGILPRMQPQDEFLRRLRQELDPAPRLRAGLLDRIGLLHDVVHNVVNGLGPDVFRTLGGSLREFFPWGARLAGLLDELALHAVAPQALRDLSGEVLPWAEALLGSLDRISQAYEAALDARGWTTPGLDSRWLAEHLDAAAGLLNGKAVLFAGFHALDRTGESIQRGLWSRGLAEVFWHSDPALALGGEPAWPAREHARLLRRWGARPELLGDPAPKAQTRRFYEGYDLHSQLSVLEHALAALPDVTSTAVVLPEPGALVPVLHHLPEAEVNISMGYPLRRSALAQLLEAVLALHENADAAGRHHWRDLVALVRQPLLRQLRCGEDAPLVSAYQAWERHIRAGAAHQAPEDWAFAYDAEAFSCAEDDARALHAEVLAACFAGFRNLGGLRQAGVALTNLCGLLRSRGAALWQRHLIDAECLLRLWQSVAPELTGSILADEPCDQGLVFYILRQLLDSERVSFEPEPLAGMQVLGVLETRLLRFRRVFLLDANEELLPGASAPDPLLPEPLRRALGLPGLRERDQVAAYNVFRLLAGAEELHVFYQAGVKPGLLDGKSVRSRYVDLLLWEEEQALGRLVKPQGAEAHDPLLKAVSFPAAPIHARRGPVRNTPALREALHERLRTGGITPTALEKWLLCPKKALYADVLRLRCLKPVAEEGDRPGFGELVHQALRDFFAPRLGRVIGPGDLDATELLALLDGRIRADAAMLQMPFEARAALLLAVRERLPGFLEAMPRTTITALELEAEAPIEVAGLATRLRGTIDRVDLRTGPEVDGRLVLDYKTGKIKDKALAGWLDDELFARMEAAEPGAPEAALVLADLGDCGLDVQLPLYLHLLARQGGPCPANAAWVELEAGGSERLLFSAKQDDETLALVRDVRVPALARFVMEQALAAAEIPARPGRHCRWCDYEGPCGS